MSAVEQDRRDRRRARSPVVAVVAVAALFVGALLMGLLHVLPATQGISAVKDTMSEYAFTSLRWLFSVAVLLIAVGVGGTFAAVVATRTVRPVSTATVTAMLAVVGLLLIVLFEKTNWALGPSLHGTIHRGASIVAFLALPLAVLAAARAVFRKRRGWRLLAQGLAVASWVCFGIVLAAIGRMLAGGLPWWQTIPLGVVQRGIALFAVLAVAALASGLLTRGERTHAEAPVP